MATAAWAARRAAAGIARMAGRPPTPRLVAATAARPRAATAANAAPAQWARAFAAPATTPKKATQQSSKLGWVVMGLLPVAAGGAALLYFGRPEPPKEADDIFPTGLESPSAATKPATSEPADPKSLGVLPGENALEGYWRRANVRVKALVESFTEPSSRLLLPDPLPPEYQRPYTLVVDLDGTLVQSKWTREGGWQTLKRTGVEEFFRRLGPYYEIVVFTQQTPFYADPILNRIDPEGYILYRLFRDSTRYADGKHIKDLSLLNRDIKKVILFEDHAEAATLQPENTLDVPEFTGDPQDIYLVKIIPFLETLALSGVEDVRPVLQAYRGKDIPAVFAEKQRKLAELKAQQQQQGGAKPRGLVSLLRSTPGVAPPAGAPPAAA